MGSKRDVGQMGENRFGEWCNSCGFSANKSRDKDSHGWDYIVEEDYAYRKDIAYDLIKEPLRFYVQIKSTDKSTIKWPIALSTVRSLVDTNYPVFFILLDYQGKLDPQKIYVKHLDHEIMEKVLKKQRVFFGEKKSIGKSTVLIIFRHQDLVSCPEEIFKKMRTYVSQGMSAYAKEKAQKRGRIGYDDGYAQLRFNVPFPPDEYVDLMLGYRDSIPVSLIEANDIRFNTPVPMPNIPKGDCKLGVHVDPQRVHVRLESGDTGKECDFVTQARFASLPQEYQKYSRSRFYNDYFDCEIGEGYLKFSMHPLFNKTMSIKKWVEFFSFSDVVSGTNKLYLTIFNCNEDQVFRLPIDLSTVINWDSRVISIANGIACFFEIFNIDEAIPFQFFNDAMPLSILSSSILKKTNINLRIQFPSILPEAFQTCYFSVVLKLIIGGKLYSLLSWGKTTVENNDNKTAFVINHFDDYIKKSREDRPHECENLVEDNNKRIISKLQTKYSEASIIPFQVESDPSFCLHLYYVISPENEAGFNSVREMLTRKKSHDEDIGQ